MFHRLDRVSVPVTAGRVDLEPHRGEQDISEPAS